MLSYGVSHHRLVERTSSKNYQAHIRVSELRLSDIADIRVILCYEFFTDSEKVYARHTMKLKTDLVIFVCGYIVIIPHTTEINKPWYTNSMD